MSPRPLAFAVLLLAVLSFPFLAEEQGERPLTDEDVVRMVVTGTPRDEILEKIRTRPTEFDLSDEMVTELKVAGIPDEILDAMRARQAEQEPEPEPAGLSEEPTPGRSRIVVAVGPEDPEREEPRMLKFPSQAPQPLVDGLELGPAPEDQAITGGAFFLACTNAIHVPDHWRRNSPLGRDFISMPRHRMLDFHPGGEVVGGSKTAAVAETALGVLTEDPDALRAGLQDRDAVAVPVPDLLQAEVDAGEIHDLLVGLALEIGGRWYLFTGANRPEVMAGQGVTELEVELLASRKGAGLRAEIRFVEPPSAETGD